MTLDWMYMCRINVNEKRQLTIFGKKIGTVFLWLMLKNCRKILWIDKKLLKQKYHRAWNLLPGFL